MSLHARQPLGALLAVTVTLRCSVAQELGAARECAPDAVRACDDGGARVQRCAASGRWGPCAPAPLAAVYEVCGNGLDDDRDGLVDDCPACRGDATRACYDGPPGSHGVGRCHAGAQRCDPLEGRFVGACEGAERPSAVELCGNAVDDDCDGATDEDCGAPRFVGLALGDRFGCALARTAEGPRVACWGDGRAEVLGVGGDPLRPALVASLSNRASLVAGAAHVCALADDGHVACAGRDDAGQLGDGASTARTAPVTVPGLDGVTALAAGRDHTCALRRDGSVWCWGDDGAAQTGATRDEATPCARSPARGCHRAAHAVDGVRGARSVAAGFAHTCALGDDGAARCWGRGAAFGVTGVVATPTAVLAGHALDAVIAGGDGTCGAWRDDEGRARYECLGAARALTGVAREADVTRVTGGATWCAWVAGEGLACTDTPWWIDLDTPSPQPSRGAVLPTAPWPVTVRDAVFGAVFGCALRDDDSVRCWGGPGSNDHGQLGRGDRVVILGPDEAVRW